MLREKALAVLEDALLRSQRAPVPPSPGLRFALAYLADNAGENRWAFDGFWRAVTSARDGELRLQRALSNLNTIYKQCGARRIVFEDKRQFVQGRQADVPREGWGVRQQRLAREKEEAEQEQGH